MPKETPVRIILEDILWRSTIGDLIKSDLKAAHQELVNHPEVIVPIIGVLEHEFSEHHHL